MQHGCSPHSNGRHIRLDRARGRARRRRARRRSRACRAGPPPRTRAPSEAGSARAQSLEYPVQRLDRNVVAELHPSPGNLENVSAPASYSDGRRSGNELEQSARQSFRLRLSPSRPSAWVPSPEIHPPRVQRSPVDVVRPGPVPDAQALPLCCGQPPARLCLVLDLPFACH